MTKTPSPANADNAGYIAHELEFDDAELGTVRALATKDGVYLRWEERRKSLFGSDLYAMRDLSLPALVVEDLYLMVHDCNQQAAKAEQTKQEAKPKRDLTPEELEARRIANGEPPLA